MMLTQNVLGNGPGLNWFIPLGCLRSRSMDYLLLSIYRIQKSLQKSHIANVYLIFSCDHIHSRVISLWKPSATPKPCRT
jgi:hypothetical protein